MIEESKEPTGWVSQIVVVPKEKKPGKVRITTDMRLANKAIVREKFPTATVEKIAYDLNGTDVFSELNLNKAFHQIELEDGALKKHAETNCTIFLVFLDYVEVYYIGKGRKRARFEINTWNVHHRVI